MQYGTGSNSPYNDLSEGCQHDYRPYSDGNWCMKCKAFKPHAVMPPVWPTTKMSKEQEQALHAKLDEILRLLREK